MKKSIHQSMRGVTLLEIMLVLAVAAMIIIMSVRYYQSASSNQQVNNAYSQVQALVAAADNLAQATGTSSYSGVTIAALTPLLNWSGSSSTSIGNSPWGSAVSVANAAATTYDITFKSVPSAVCSLFLARLTANNHFSSGTTCSSSAPTDVTVTYTANP